MVKDIWVKHALLISTIHKLKFTSFSGLFSAALPPAPQSTSSQSLSSTTLRVKWALLIPVTDEYGTILEYVITCSAQGDQLFETVQGTTSQSTLTGLEPSTTYNCCVSAENIAGKGIAVCGEGTTLNETSSSGISSSLKIIIGVSSGILVITVLCIAIICICVCWWLCKWYRNPFRYEIKTDRVMLILPSFLLYRYNQVNRGELLHVHCALSIPL